MTRKETSREEVINTLIAAVPAGKPILTEQDRRVLRAPTAALIELAAVEGEEELRRFQDMKGRGLPVDPSALLAAHRDKTILVTGGTGCIGGSLLAEIVRLHPRRLVSISRGITQPAQWVAGVEYVFVDIRDAESLAEVFDAVVPDVVYHLAAQHDPGLAEIEVARTLSTNITGSVNVFNACAERGIPVVHASTGKALRPFSRDVYAASKKISEWLLNDAISAGRLVGTAGRFTHVVDNSIISDRIVSWVSDHMPVRLHSPDVSFYLQSAREAAQLLLCVGLDVLGGEFRLGTIRDLGWPISLIDLAVGCLAGCDDPPPVYICGFEAGYEKAPYPALYDPQVSGERSPLLNSMEAASTFTASFCDEVDVCVVAPQSDAGTRAQLEGLGRAATADADPALLKSMLEDSAWAMLASNVAAQPTPVLCRHIDLVRSTPAELFSMDDHGVVEVVEWELIQRSKVGEADPGEIPAQRSELSLVKTTVR